MRLYNKISFIKNCVYCDTEYLELSKNFGYKIEDYISVVSDLVTDDLKWKMELFSKKNFVVNDWFTDYTDVIIDDNFILTEYSKFLVYMHYQVLKKNCQTQLSIRNLHISKYDLNSQRNFWNTRKKFFLA